MANINLNVNAWLFGGLDEISEASSESDEGPSVMLWGPLEEDWDDDEDEDED